MTQEVQVHKAIKHAQGLEDAIAEARENYADLGPEAVEAYISPLVNELRITRARIDEALGIDQPAAETAELWMRLRGGRIGDGRAPLDSIEKVFGALQKGVRQIGAYLKQGEASLRRIPQEIVDEVDLDLVAFSGGSARVGLAPRTVQLELTDDLSLSESSILRIVEGFHWAQSEAPYEALEDLFPSPVVRRQFLTRVNELAPGPREDYEMVEFSGSLVERQHPRVKVSVTAHEHAGAFLERRSTEQLTKTGRLVAIDVERDEFRLRTSEGRIKCTFDNPEVYEAAKDMLEKKVKIHGQGEFRRDEDLPTEILVEAISVQ